MMRIKFKYSLQILISCLLLMIAMSSYAQDVIKGKVIDKETKEPLPGAAIVISGTSVGVTADIDGNFTINAKAGDKLTISFVGYEPYTVEVRGKNELVVELRSEKQELDEVVVVGHGTMKKSHMTGAVDQVKGSEVFDKRPLNNAVAGLQGRIAGLNIGQTMYGGDPSAEMTINIRGVTSVGMDEQGNSKINKEAPLVVIDGIPGGNINDVNPNDVETISVLKDAAAAAIYGSRAPNGVIIITTKGGGYEKPLRVNVSYTAKMSHPIQMPEILNSVQYLTLENETWRNSTGSPRYGVDYLERLQQHIDNPEEYPAVVPKKDDPTQWQADQYANTDWFGVMMKNHTMDHKFDANLSGGGSKVAYYFGLGYNGNSGILKYADDRFQRYTFNANFDVKMTKWANLKFVTNYTHKKTDGPFVDIVNNGVNNWFHQISRQNPRFAAIDPNGHLMGMALQLTASGRKVTNENIGQYMATLNIELLKGLTLTGDIGYRNTGKEYTERKNTVKGYNAIGQQNSKTNDSYLKKVNSYRDYYSVSGKIKYDKSIQNHNFSAMLGWQIEYEKFKEMTGKRNKLLTESLPSFNLAYGDSDDPTEKIDEWAVEGYFFRLNYNYKEKYLFEFVGRYDGSSRYLKKDRWNFFPSVSGAYLISRENFWQNMRFSEILHTLKLRASWGQLGALSNQNIFDILNTSAGNLGSWHFSGTNNEMSVSLPNKLTSANITWAKPTTLNIGLDFGMLNNRLNGTFEWFQKTIIDQVGPARAYPGILGIKPPASNDTESRTRGFELTLSWKDNIGDFIYGVRATLDNSRSKITKYDNPDQLLSSWLPGRRVGEIWGYETDHMIRSEEEVKHMPDQSKLYSQWKVGDIMYVDVNKDGVIDDGQRTLNDKGDLVVIGNSEPQYNFGLTLDLEWKGIFVSTFWQGVGKRDWFPSTPYFWGSNNNKWNNIFFANHWRDIWREDNPSGYLPRVYCDSQGAKNTQVQSGYLQNAAYLRLKNLTFGYSLPKSILKKAYINELSVYASVENLWTVSGLDTKYIDPELTIGDAKIYPLQRVWSIGLTLSF